MPKQAAASYQSAALQAELHVHAEPVVAKEQLGTPKPQSEMIDPQVGWTVYLHQRPRHAPLHRTGRHTCQTQAACLWGGILPADVLPVGLHAENNGCGRWMSNSCAHAHAWTYKLLHCQAASTPRSCTAFLLAQQQLPAQWIENLRRMCGCRYGRHFLAKYIASQCRDHKPSSATQAAPLI